MNRLFSAKTSAVTACGHTRGENANRDAAASAAHRLPDHRATARNRIVAAPAPHAAENRFTRHAIEPLFGIVNQRTDKRIDFVGGGRGLEGLEKRVASGEMAVAFALYPTQMTDLMAVADAGLIMPPKSTWFEPKLADGMVNHVLD